MTRTQRIVTLLMVALVAAIVTSFTSSQGTALIRFLHLDAGTPTLDITLNGELAAADLPYGETTARLTVSAGQADMAAYLAGTSVEIASQRITLNGGAAAIILADAGDSRVHIVNEDLAPLPFGNSRLAFFNALDVQAQASIALQDETLIMETLAAGSASSSVASSADTYDIVLETGGEMPIGSIGQPLAAGSFNLLAIHGSSAAPELLNSASELEGEADSGRVRFIHAIEGAAPVDLRVDGQLIVPALAFAAPSPSIALPAGSRDIAVNLGAAEIMSERVQLRAGERITVILMRTNDGLGIFAFADAASAVNAESAVVSLVNSIPDSVINYLQLESGAIIALNVQTNEAGSSAKIVPGRQAMTLHLNIGGNQGEVPISPRYFHSGSYYRLVALAGGVFSAPRLLIVESSLQREISALPASADVAPKTISAPEKTTHPDTPAVVEPIAESASQQQAVEPDTQESAEQTPEELAAVAVEDVVAQDDSQSDAPMPPEPSLTPYATVKVNPDAALHMRQYPSSDAMSLGLLPSASNLMILGRRGPSQFSGEPNPLP